jgi:hypothetical protein
VTGWAECDNIQIIMSAEKHGFLQDIGKLTDPFLGKEIEAGFSCTQRELLTEKGYSIYSLTGKTMSDLAGLGLHFWSEWQRGDDIIKMPSLITEVAYYPGLPFLPDSSQTSYRDLVIKTLLLTMDINQKIPGILFMIGSPVDYAEIALAQYIATGQTAFDLTGENVFAVTSASNRENDSQIVVGCFDLPIKDTAKIIVTHTTSVGYTSVRHADLGKNPNIRLFPLIVPVAAK